MKSVISLFFITLIFSGCFEREIYTEVMDKRYISHPPASVLVVDLEGNLKSGFPSNPTSPISVHVYTHRAHCTNAQSRSLGSDFDGYVRITIKDGNTTIARAQSDYKGGATPEMVQTIYTELLKQLRWRPQ
jgi:hypothetical protein